MEKYSLDELKEMLIKLSKKGCWCDNKEFMINDYAGGNIDDAYYGGSNDGEILLAREILKYFFEND